MMQCFNNQYSRKNYQFNFPVWLFLDYKVIFFSKRNLSFLAIVIKCDLRSHLILEITDLQVSWEYLWKTVEIRRKRQKRKEREKCFSGLERGEEREMFTRSLLTCSFLAVLFTFFETRTIYQSTSFNLYHLNEIIFLSKLFIHQY